MPHQPNVTAAKALQGLIEVTRLARSGGTLATRLERLAGTIGDSLGYATVVITLYRSAWDDFCIAAVSGREDARRLLLGCTRTWDDYRPLLDDRFLRRGGYVIPFGSFDWSHSGTRYTPPVEPSSDDPDAWHPQDVLLLPLKAADGALLGMISVDEPANLRRPTDDDLDVLAAVADHVALAIEEAQEDVAASRHRASLQHLLQVSSRLTETLSVDVILQSVCDAIRRALGFQRVSVELAGADDAAFSPRAYAGWGTGGPPRSGLTRETIAPLLDPAFEVEGCYLLPLEVARARVTTKSRWASTLNGAGPRAWNRHWLVVPLNGRDGSLEGFIWVDDPADRLLPSQEKLQALRLFANQATTALNDRSGHLVGDDHLVGFADLLATSVRRADFAYRVGGDEFALILVESDEDDARRVVERIADRLASDVTAGVSASFGLAVYEGNGDSDELFRRADEAMYLAKRSDSSVAVAA